MGGTKRTKSNNLQTPSVHASNQPEAGMERTRSSKNDNLHTLPLQASNQSEAGMGRTRSSKHDNLHTPPLQASNQSEAGMGRITTMRSNNPQMLPLHTSDQSVAGLSISRHPIMQAPQPQITVNQSDAGLSNSRQLPAEEPQIQENDTGSPLSSSLKQGLTREELQEKTNKCNIRLKERAGKRTERDKGKQKAHTNEDSPRGRKKIARAHRIILEHMLELKMQCKARAFVFGMVPKNSKPMTGASDSLRAWWKNEIMFDKNAPSQIEQYYIENSISTQLHQDDEAKSTTELLMELSDPTIGSVLSLLMQHCDPPQKKFPFEKKVPPPWWPTTSEGWWVQTGIPRDQGRPPYRKPHDLRKKWKVAVVLGIIKNMSPDFSRPYNLAKQSPQLQGRMNAKEVKFWNLALVAEAKRYCQEHHDKPLDQAIAFLEALGGRDPRVGHNADNQTAHNFGNQDTRYNNLDEVMHQQPFAPPSGMYSPWSSTVPPMGQLQQDIQASGNIPNSQVNISGSFGPQYPHWGYSYSPVHPAYVPSEVQQNHAMGGLGAPSSNLQELLALASQSQPFGAQPGGSSTVGTQNVQNQMQGGNVEFGLEPSFGNRSYANGD